MLLFLYKRIECISVFTFFSIIINLRSHNGLGALLIRICVIILHHLPNPFFVQMVNLTNNFLFSKLHIFHIFELLNMFLFDLVIYNIRDRFFFLSSKAFFETTMETFIGRISKIYETKLFDGVCMENGNPFLSLQP